MLTPGNVSDVKAAPALLKHTGRTRYLLGDKGKMPIACAGLSVRHAPPPSFLGAATGSEPLATSNSDNTTDTSSRMPPATKNLCRAATLYDKLAANFLSAVALATAVAFWL